MLHWSIALKNPARPSFFHQNTSAPIDFNGAITTANPYLAEEYVAFHNQMEDYFTQEEVFSDWHKAHFISAQKQMPPAEESVLAEPLKISFFNQKEPTTGKKRIVTASVTSARPDNHSIRQFLKHFMTRYYFSTKERRYFALSNTSPPYDSTPRKKQLLL